jgi:arsenite methyltransferase
MLRPIAKRVLTTAALLAVCWTCAAQQRDPEQYAGFLESPDRVARMQVPRVVEALAIKPGQRVADIGSGSGLFARAFARAVGEGGTVYAVDIDPALLEIVQRRARAEGVTTIVSVQATADTPNLPRAVDLVFICDTLHHIENRAAYLSRLRASLEPGGRIAVIDFSKDWPGGHADMRYTPEQLDTWMRAGGYQRVAVHDFLKNNFFVVYQRNGGS